MNTIKKTWAFILTLAIAVTLVCASSVTVFATDAQSLTGYAHSETNTSTGDVFLGGRYIELGISKHGSFGTSTSPKTSGFHTSSQLGMIIDGDGWDTGNAPTTGDFFLPGTPEERYILAYYYNGTKYEFPVADRRSTSVSNWSVAPTVTDCSYGNTLCAVVRGVTVHGVELKLTYSFKDTDKAYSTTVEITNNGSYDITNVRFVRSFDPDQDQQTKGTFYTYNKVICNPDYTLPASETNYAMVVARGATTYEGFFFIAFDNRARASRGVEFALSSAYKSGLWSESSSLPTYATDDLIALSSSNRNGYTYEDNAIAITFALGTLSNGGGYTTANFYSSLSPDVNESLEEVTKPSAPIIGSVSGAELEHGYTEGAVSVSATAERLHTLSYQWYVNSVDSNVGGTAVSGATASSYSLPTGKLANTSEYYYCVVTATRTDNGLSASVTTDPVKVVYKDGEHSFKLVSSIDATCTSVGHKYYKCELCAKTKTETVPALGHTVGEWVVDSEASCTASGVKHTSCTVCGKLIENVYMPASGHNYVSVVTRKATCDQPGIITTTCSVCGDKSIKYVYTEHSYSVSEYVAPTCTVDGKYVYSCSECGHSYTETIPGSHDYEMKVTREATETETGLVTYTCSACGDSYTETTPIRATANVLLVQDRLPWSENSNTALLKKLVDDGYIAGWDIITSAALADTDISGYKLIYIANDQNNATYSNLNACGSKLTEYANAGGVIVYGACDMGWSGGSISYTLPGGVTTNNYYSNRNYIVNKDNPIVTGALTDGQALTDQILYGTYCSHTYFTSLPEGAMIVLSDANGNPTLVVYPQNDGYIIATGLTWEYSYVRDLVSGGSFAKNVYDDLIVYALSLIDSCDHAYDAGTVVAPTCTEAGYVLHTCSVCGMSYRDGFTKATGHLNTEWTTVSDASATESGLKKKICKDCGETLATEIIAPIKSPSANVTSKSDSVVVNKDITFDIVISNADKVKGLKIVPVYDKNVLELLGMEWSVSADSSSVDCDGALAIAEWLSATDVNTAVLKLTFRALALSDGTSVSCTVTLSDESGTPDIAVVGKNISVITCPHTNVSYGKMNESYHSVVCSDCGYSTVAEHVYSSPTDATCDACGYLDTDVIVDKGNCGAGQKWSINAGGTLTVSGSGASWGYSSPSDIPWYSYADTIKNVVFEKGVTCIGSYAFYGCTGLTEITLPETLTEILDHAFEGCTGITVIIIPAKVTTIGASAFKGCTGLENVTVPASVTTIGKNAFGGCTGLTGISFDRTLGWEANGKIVYATVIASETEALRLLTSKYAKAEWKCDTSVVANGSCGSSSDWKLTDSGVITVCGSGVTDNYSAGTQPWADRKADITAIVISDGVTYIGNCAFYECVNVKSITIPASVVVIGRYAFYSCKGVTEVVIPSTVVSIGVYAFRKTAVTSVTFESPNDWLIDRTVVSSDVLSDPALAASYLKKEHYTESWSKIGEDGVIASGSCGTALTWKLDSSYVLTVSGNGKMSPYNSAQSPWYSYSSLITGVIVEEGVTSIGRAAFYGCENIVNVSLPSTVRSIGEYAFYYCIKLDSLTVPASVTEIGKYAFRRCSALSGVTLENAYGWSADEKRLYSYELGEANAATYLKNEYFNVDWTRDTELGADSEESGIIAGGICGSNVKWKLSESGVLTVYGKGAMYDYSAGDTPWASYADVITEVVISDGVTSVGARAFYRHTAITTVTLGKNVASIGLEAFFYCTSLTDIVIPESVHSIGKYAFRKCNALENAHLECADCWSVNGTYVSASGLADGATAAEYLSKVYYASEWTFVGGNCGKNAKWKLSESGVLTVYGKGAMYDYGSNGAPWASYRSSIVSIVVSEGVTSVGNCAFYGCACAVSVTLPSTLTEIGNYAFYGCSALEELNVPASVNVIGSYAFRKCNALATVTFGNAEGWLCDGVSAEISADALVSDYRSEWTRA